MRHDHAAALPGSAQSAAVTAHNRGMRTRFTRVEQARERLSANRRVAAARAWWDQSIGGRGLARVRELDLDTHALALCAQQVLCTAPLVVALSAVLQRETGNNISVYIARFFGLSEGSEDDIARLFGRTSASISTPTLIVGLIVAVVFMTSVGAVQQRAFELIWTLPRITGLRSYLRQLLFAPAVALFTIGVLFAGKIGHSINRNVMSLGPWAGMVLQGVMVLLFYWWAQYWLLNRRVSMRALLPGAVAVGVLSTIQVRVSRAIVPGQISWQVHAYGLVGAVFVLSVWLMVASGVIFGGVLLGALITERRTDPTFGRIRGTDNATLTRRGTESTALAHDGDDASGGDGVVHSTADAGVGVAVAERLGEAVAPQPVPERVAPTP